jgi:hypothetical protein
VLLEGLCQLEKDLIGNRTGDLSACRAVSQPRSSMVGGGVELGPLGTAATNRPIVSARVIMMEKLVE